MATAGPSLWENPLQTDGFEFVEYAAPDPAALGVLFEQMGFSAIAKHRSKNVLLYRQGDINFIVNREPTGLDRIADLVIHHDIGETLGPFVGN